MNNVLLRVDSSKENRLNPSLYNEILNKKASCSIKRGTALSLEYIL